jgi:hypothetical protein
MCVTLYPFLGYTPRHLPRIFFLQSGDLMSKYYFYVIICHRNKTKPKRDQVFYKSWIGGLEVVTLHYKARNLMRGSPFCQVSANAKLCNNYSYFNHLCIPCYDAFSRGTIFDPSSHDFICPLFTSPCDIRHSLSIEKWWFHVISLFVYVIVGYMGTNNYKRPSCYKSWVVSEEGVWTISLKLSRK